MRSLRDENAGYFPALSLIALITSALSSTR